MKAGCLGLKGIGVNLIIPLLIPGANPVNLGYTDVSQCSNQCVEYVKAEYCVMMAGWWRCMEIYSADSGVSL